MSITTHTTTSPTSLPRATTGQSRSGTTLPSHCMCLRFRMLGAGLLANTLCVIGSPLSRVIPTTSHSPVTTPNSQSSSLAQKTARCAYGMPTRIASSNLCHTAWSEHGASLTRGASRGLPSVSTTAPSSSSSAARNRPYRWIHRASWSGLDTMRSCQLSSRATVSMHSRTRRSWRALETRILTEI